ncbi:hypothetical protein [Nocardioides sp.]|uniref:hypothetical protein n=1 Tax=Nocardioides sp. TaxID=35761 RepID=UPI002BAF6A41|nr:hypothetical protein [Nocardioides sp.]HXH80759.1 hypothetical protein [Nocardioides sp.]
MPETTRLIGVYDAKGSLLGEVAYLWGKVRGTRHCALCDLTHNRVRRRPEWDQLVARLDVPMDLLHLDELPVDVADAVAAHGTPVVFARTSEGLQPVVLPAELDGLSGSVERLGDLLRAHLSGRPA